MLDEIHFLVFRSDCCPDRHASNRCDSGILMMRKYGKGESIVGFVKKA